MKFFFLLIFLIFFGNDAFSQAALESSTAFTLSPFATVTRLLETSTASTLGTIENTLVAIRSRSVAEKEQLKDELIDLNNDLVSGEIREISEMRQVTLQELFLEISADEKKMGEINSLIPAGPKLYRIAVVVTLSLF